MIADGLKHYAVVGRTVLLSWDGPLVNPHNKGLGFSPAHLDEWCTRGALFCCGVIEDIIPWGLGV